MKVLNKSQKLRKTIWFYDTKDNRFYFFKNRLKREKKVTKLLLKNIAIDMKPERRSTERILQMIGVS